MRAIQVSRKKLYELINTGELESYTEGKSRRITVKSINDYIERRLAAEAVRRGRVHPREMINHVRKRDSRLATQPAGVAIKKVIYLPHLTSSH